MVKLTGIIFIVLIVGLVSSVGYLSFTGKLGAGSLLVPSSGTVFIVNCQGQNSNVVGVHLDNAGGDQYYNAVATDCVMLSQHIGEHISFDYNTGLNQITHIVLG